MIPIRKIATLFALLFMALPQIKAQEPATALPPNVCKLENGNLVFYIDLRWTEKQKKELEVQFDLDSLLIAEVYNGKTAINTDNEQWVVQRVNKHTVALRKPMEKGSFVTNLLTAIFAEHSLSSDGRPGYVDKPVAFGANAFRNSTVIIGADNVVTFLLLGNTNAQQVYLSGSFNNWSTMQTPMSKLESGWGIKIKLEPGKYYYKFIVDGNWKHDYGNLLREDDGNGGYNSVLFVPNYTFKLQGNTSASKVYLSGTFNGWSHTGNPMRKTDTGWELPVYLNDGMHEYKFIVDGNWITDPQNQKQKQNEHNSYNSVLTIGKSTKFTLSNHQKAKTVYLAGSFNSWNPTGIPMQKVDAGWTIEQYLPAGNHEYKFVVDGNWITDPNNTLTAKDGPHTNSLLCVNTNHTFQLEGFSNAQSVVVTGSFCGWNRTKYTMTKKNGKWTLTLHLPKGKHTYKFIVDGEWIHDPNNKLYEVNEHNSLNSIIWIE